MPEEASLVITNSGIPNAIPEPGFIAFGELTLNWADSALYFKDKDGNIQSISTKGLPPIEFDAHIPEDEPLFVFHAGTTPNTTYSFVQKQDGDLPRLKVGYIGSGVNYVNVDGTDITVGILPGTTVNQVKSLIDNDEEASAIIYFYTDFRPFSDGTGVSTDWVILGSAVFQNAVGKAGDRSDILGQSAIVTHSSPVAGSYKYYNTEWVVVGLRPTRWAPRTPGVIWNFDTQRWEMIVSQDGILQSVLLPDQAPLP